MSGCPSFGSIYALTKVFMERNWPPRRNHILTKGKTSAAVACGQSRNEELSKWFEIFLAGYLGARYHGALVLEGSVPCLGCGHGETSKGSGFLSRNGPGAKIASARFSDFDRDESARARAAELDRAMGEAGAA